MVADFLCHQMFNGMQCGHFHMFTVWLFKTDVIFVNHISYVTLCNTCMPYIWCFYFFMIQLETFNIHFLLHSTLSSFYRYNQPDKFIHLLPTYFKIMCGENIVENRNSRIIFAL